MQNRSRLQQRLAIVNETKRKEKKRKRKEREQGQQVYRGSIEARTRSDTLFSPRIEGAFLPCISRALFSSRLRHRFYTRLRFYSSNAITDQGRASAFQPRRASSKLSSSKSLPEPQSGCLPSSSSFVIFLSLCSCLFPE